MEPYVIPIFTDEWWRNNIVTFLIIGFLLFIGNKLNKKNNYFNLIIGSFLILRLPWNQYYQYQIGQYNLEWSLPLQMCSFSSFFSGLILVLHGLNIDKKYKIYCLNFCYTGVLVHFIHLLLHNTQQELKV